MTTETITRIKLIASDGMVLTDGKVYGKEIFLAENKTADDFYEITDADYEEIIKKETFENNIS